MNKQDQMTMQEAERKMESLREVFQVVRLVDGKMLMDREKRINAGELANMQNTVCGEYADNEYNIWWNMQMSH